MSGVHALSLTESARLLWGLTRPDRVDHLNRIAEQYPDGAVLTTPLNRMLITSTPTATKHVLVTHHRNFKKGMGQSHARQIIGDGLLTAEGRQWQEQRKDAAPALRAKSVEAKYDSIAQLARSSAESFAQSDWNGVGFDPAVALTEYTLSCLGSTIGFAAPPAKQIHDAFETVQNEALFRSVSQSAVPLRFRPNHRQRLDRALTTLALATAASIAGQERHEKWATKEGLTSLFLAGYETTASTLAWTITHLAARPQLQEQIRQEAEPVLEEGQRTARWHLGELRVTEATFKETLRLRPPVWLLSRETTQPDVVDGVELRPGDEVLLLPSVVARRGWEDPGVFRPERFLEPGQGQGLWFGAGPRACPGGALANTEAVLWLAYACSAVEFRLRPGTRVTALARMSQAPAQDLRHLLSVVPRTVPEVTHLRLPAMALAGEHS